jgi:serine/threonine protein kinase
MADYYPENAESTDPLIGAKLKDGWTITSRITRKAKQTGGAFSYGYRAQRGGDEAYLKAYDFERVFQADEPMKELEKTVKSFNFEVEVLDLCARSNMKRIVRAIAHGVIDNDKVPFGKLYYLLFELAEDDIRGQVIADNSGKDVAKIAWSLRSLHQIAAALQQLHARGIFHQDLRPSNILVFDGHKVSKLADFGRSHCAAMDAPHDEARVPGAWRYAPPELLYDAPLPDKKSQRAAAELYLFGSMIFFFVMHVPMTPELMTLMRPEHRMALFGGTNLGVYFRDVLPFLVDGHDQLLRLFKMRLTELLSGDQNSAEKITDLLRYATLPDPALRGHPSARRIKFGNPYELQRFVSAFNLIAWAVEREAVKLHA